MHVHCTCQCKATIRTWIRTRTRIRTRIWIRTRTWARIRFRTRTSTSGLWTHLSRRVVHKLCRGWSNWYQNHSCHWLPRRPWRLPWWPWGLPWRLACPQFWSWRELNWCDVNVHPFACSCSYSWLCFGGSPLKMTKIWSIYRNRFCKNFAAISSSKTKHIMFLLTRWRSVNSVSSNQPKKPTKFL